ncbi:mitochondrial calcium uniporter regulator 1 isoform X5 [Myripristis murdjan]|uniref:mitochondrial calcium uniporter regulator 1 isoform X5 n=1 Tax=Myripristis murdjan TaxID=586833 RepID=UPI001175FE52|nr:mitochondrial calcium uniporter regulator 1-like isoform X5 [Myripristis murdjan]
MLQTQSCSLWKASFFSPQLCYEAIYNSTGGIHTLIPAKFNFSPFRRSVTDASSSPCLQCMSSPGFNDTGRPPWRRGPRLTTMHFLKRTRVFVRGLSTSIRACQYDLKADMPKPGSQKLFFDTHSVVRLLEENGFSTQQAEVIVKLLVRTTNSNMEAIYNDMVTKVQQKIKIQLLQLKVQLADVMNKVRSDTILDMNLEKSHVKEMKAEHEKKLLETRTEIMEMTAEQDRHLAQTNMKIDTEVAGLKTMLESHKLDTIKYLAGSVFTCLTVVLGFYRIWM